VKGGCTSTIAKGPGSRLRHTLDRDSAAYRTLFDQRTMVERITSQAEALGILHPNLRRGRAIVNQTTMTYVLINLRAIQRLRATAFWSLAFLVNLASGNQALRTASSTDLRV
jgi:hypothetical protein